MKGIATDPAKLASIRAALATRETYQSIAIRHGVSIETVKRTAIAVGIQRNRKAVGKTTQRQVDDAPGAPVAWLNRPPPRIMAHLACLPECELRLVERMV